MRKYITKASERIGVESTSRDGKRAQVVSYSTCENFIIRFCDKFFYRDCSRNALSRGKRNDCVRILSGKVKNI